jgi:hypothetical protein
MAEGTGALHPQQTTAAGSGGRSLPYSVQVLFLTGRDHWRCAISAPMTVNPERVAFIHGCGENSINQRPPFLDNERCPPAASRRLGPSKNSTTPVLLCAKQLAYVYYESEPGRRSAAKLLSKDEVC